MITGSLQLPDTNVFVRQQPLLNPCYAASTVSVKEVARKLFVERVLRSKYILDAFHIFSLKTYSEAGSLFPPYI